MNCFRNGFSEIIEGSKITEKLGKEGINEKSLGETPDKKFINSGFGDGAFFPGDVGMKKIG